MIQKENTKKIQNTSSQIHGAMDSVDASLIYQKFDDEIMQMFDHDDNISHDGDGDFDISNKLQTYVKDDHIVLGEKLGSLAYRTPRMGASMPSQNQGAKHSEVISDNTPSTQKSLNPRKRSLAPALAKSNQSQKSVTKKTSSVQAMPIGTSGYEQVKNDARNIAQKSIRQQLTTGRPFDDTAAPQVRRATRVNAAVENLETRGQNQCSITTSLSDTRESLASATIFNKSDDVSVDKRPLRSVRHASQRKGVLKGIATVQHTKTHPFAEHANVQKEVAAQQHKKKREELQPQKASGQVGDRKKIISVQSRNQQQVPQVKAFEKGVVREKSPVAFQLGQPIRQGHTAVNTEIVSTYRPTAPTTLKKDKVQFFDTSKSQKKHKQEQGEYVQKSPVQQRSFAEKSQKLKKVQQKKDPAEFLNGGVITFDGNATQKKAKSSQKPVTTTRVQEGIAAFRNVQEKNFKNQNDVFEIRKSTRAIARGIEEDVHKMPIPAQKITARQSPKGPRRGRLTHMAEMIVPAQLRQAQGAVAEKVVTSAEKIVTPSAKRSDVVTKTTKTENVWVPQKMRQSRLQHPTNSHVEQKKTHKLKKKSLLEVFRFSRIGKRRSPQKSSSAKNQKPVKEVSQKSVQASIVMPKTDKKRLAPYVVGGIVILVASIGFFRYGAATYAAIKTATDRGFGNLNAAVASAKVQDFDVSQKTFRSALRDLDRADASLDSINSGIIAISQYIPFLSKLSSGKSAIEAGQSIARAGAALSSAAKVAKGIENPLDGKISLLNMYEDFSQQITIAHTELKKADAAVAKITISDIPEDKRTQFIELQRKLPVALSALERFRDTSHVIADLLGANGPRKYLFLFQNNHEARATGGFIGSYGRLDISHGEVRQFFIDGIFNPNGQLFEKIIPPRPIQKISAAWSLHDSNWFPHFPTSAEEAIVFYERTGGPTVDGVITITPVVLQRFLEVTGPIKLPDYDTKITAKNFMERLQYEVEIDYDKTENRPKKILSDLAPMILARVFASEDGSDIKVLLDIMNEMLVEKHILMYARNQEVQGWIEAAGWGGTIKQTQRDYLSVVNTNINGYKTDGVIDESIYHWAEIQEDGSIIDTVRIVRHHNGGDTPYQWWNEVNANYMRVYVPKGAELISVSGQTREFTDPPIDYIALDFQGDSRVVEEEQSMVIDDATGTRIYEQNDKTVFANWTYVSPQETMTIEYSYRLPFVLDLAPGEADTYSILFQKQHGSIGSQLTSRIVVPSNMRDVWQYPKNITGETWEDILDTDQFRGMVLAPFE